MRLCLTTFVGESQNRGAAGLAELRMNGIVHVRCGCDLPLELELYPPCAASRDGSIPSRSGYYAGASDKAANQTAAYDKSPHEPTLFWHTLISSGEDIADDGANHAAGKPIKKRVYQNCYLRPPALGGGTPRIFALAVLITNSRAHCDSKGHTYNGVLHARTAARIRVRGHNDDRQVRVGCS